MTLHAKCSRLNGKSRDLHMFTYSLSVNAQDEFNSDYKKTDCWHLL